MEDPLNLPQGVDDGYLKTSGLLAMSKVQAIADQHRVVPGPSIQRLIPREFDELFRSRPQQNQLAALRDDKELPKRCLPSLAGKLRRAPTVYHIQRVLFRTLSWLNE